MNEQTQPIAAVSAIVRREGRYLLVRRGNPPLRGMYAFPGGRVEIGETLAEAALRELKEETGLTGRNPRFHSRHDLGGEGGPDVPWFELSTFLVDIDHGTPVVAGDDAEAVGWYTAAIARSLAIPDSVRICIDDLEGDGVIISETPGRN
jgi:ADP-ribose pyrophosphatase YjhB (NUDIX family)